MIEPDVTVIAGSRPAGPLAMLAASVAAENGPLALEMVVVGSGTVPEISGSGGLAIHRCLRAEDLDDRPLGRHLLLVAPEVILSPGCLRALVDFMDATPEAGLAAPRVVDAFGRAEPAARPFPGPLALAAMSAPGRLLLPRSWLRARGYHLRTGAAPLEVDWITGGVRLARRELTDDFPASALAHGEEGRDLLLCRRARRLGWRVYAVPAAGAAHLAPLVYHPEQRPRRAEGLGLVAMVRYIACCLWR